MLPYQTFKLIKSLMYDQVMIIQELREVAVSLSHFCLFNFYISWFNPIRE